jgi:drug/metabolite transporter (DMT)-like permease
LAVPSMEIHVFLAVLFAAACHAGWNSLLKLRLEPLLALSLISAAAGLVMIVLLPFVSLPPLEAWKYIFASLAIHMVYYVSLGEAYRTGDLGQVYPIARGAAPLMTALGAWHWHGEALGQNGWFGVFVLATGIMVLSLKGSSGTNRFDRRAVGFALITALSISAYTLADGTGARVGDSAWPYIVWLFVLDGLMMLVFGLVYYRRQFVTAFQQSWLLVLGGGALSAAAYAIAIWAMTQAPIAMVAALRETSVLFAAVIGVIVLKEAVRPIRIAAAVLVMSGMLLLRLR